MARRTASLTIRMDPKTKYAASLTAAVKRVTLSTFIENALLDSIGDSSLVENTWDSDESSRFAKLAWIKPSMLTFEEEVLWKIIQQTKELWLMDGERDNSDETHKLNCERFNFALLKKQWSVLTKRAKAEAAKQQTTVHGSFTFRGGKIDATLNESITEE